MTNTIVNKIKHITRIARLGILLLKPTWAVRWHVDISATTSSNNVFGDAFPEASLLRIVLEVIQLLLTDTIAVWWWYVDILKCEAFIITTNHILNCDLCMQQQRIAYWVAVCPSPMLVNL